MAVKRIIVASLPLSGCAMDTADGIGIGLFGLAILVVLPVLLYPPLKTWIERRDHRRRMSRAWREAQATRRPVDTGRKRRTRRPKGA